MTPDEPKNPLKDRRLVSRRALVRAGWTVPVVLALHLPPNALAQYACTHADVPATAHVDVAAEPHADNGEDLSDPDHIDVPAQAHVDVPATAHADATVCD